MRPNVDIPWSIHGNIKEHAERTGQTIEDAYIETLREGIKDLPESNTDATLPQNSYKDFGPRLIRSQGTESHHINDSLTFHPFFDPQEHAMEIGTRREDFSISKLRDALASLHEVGYISDTWFTIQQLGGALVGRGPRNFITALEDAQARFTDAEVPMYKSGHVLYIGSLNREGEYIALRGELPRRSDELQALGSVELRFITKGVPIGGDSYYRMARCLGFTELFNATPLSLLRTWTNLPEDYPIEIIDEIVTPESRGTGDESVSGLIVKNPIQQDEGLFRTVKEDIPDDHPDATDAQADMDTLANYDEVYCSLRNHASHSRNNDYKLKGVEATYIQPLFHRNGTWNLSVRTDW